MWTLIPASPTKFPFVGYLNTLVTKNPFLSGQRYSFSDGYTQKPSNHLISCYTFLCTLFLFDYQNNVKHTQPIKVQYICHKPMTKTDQGNDLSNHSLMLLTPLLVPKLLENYLSLPIFQSYNSLHFLKEGLPLKANVANPNLNGIFPMAIIIELKTNIKHKQWFTWHTIASIQTLVSSYLKPKEALGQLEDSIYYKRVTLTYHHVPINSSQ